MGEEVGFGARGAVLVRGGLLGFYAPTSPFAGLGAFVCGLGAVVEAEFTASQLVSNRDLPGRMGRVSLGNLHTLYNFRT